MNDPGVRGWSGQPCLTPGHVSPWGYLASFEMNGVSKGLLASAHHYVLFFSPSANSANIWKKPLKNGVLTGLSLIPFFLHAFEWHGARQKTSTDLKLKATQEFAMFDTVSLWSNYSASVRLTEISDDIKVKGGLTDIIWAACCDITGRRHLKDIIMKIFWHSSAGAWLWKHTD